MAEAHSNLLFNASHARNLAESKWGRPHIGFKTKRLVTNRKGAFYFDCSAGSGFIIDGRALSQHEHQAIAPYHEADTAEEYFDDKSRFMMRTNPYTSQYNRKPAHRPQAEWKEVSTQVYAFQVGVNACLPIIFAGIATENQKIEEALRDFQEQFDASAHDLIELRSVIAARAA